MWSLPSSKNGGNSIKMPWGCFRPAPPIASSAAAGGRVSPGTAVAGGGSALYSRLPFAGAGGALRGRGYAPENSRGQTLPGNHSPTVALDQHSGGPGIPRPTDLATGTSPLEKRE